MATRIAEERIRELEEKKERAKARADVQVARANNQIRRIRGRQQKKEQREETRRQYLVGTMVFHLIDTGKWEKKSLLDYMDAYLKINHVRELFSLPQVEQGGTVNKKKTREKDKSTKTIRKEEYRRIFEVGRMVFNLVDTGEWEEKALLEYMDAFLMRDSDRGLFGLQPLGITVLGNDLQHDRWYDLMYTKIETPFLNDVTSHRPYWLKLYDDWRARLSRFRGGKKTTT